MKRAAAAGQRLSGWFELAWLYALSLYKGWETKALFRNVETYCMFIGYPRSGHSLIGSLLDAHPEVIIAHELDALRYVRAGFGREQLCYLLLENSQRYAREGRQETGYSYDVPNQWQGKFGKLRVIGDKKGGRSTFALGAHCELIERLRNVVGVPVKFIHVMRNPYDNIATISIQHTKQTLKSSIDYYFSLCRIVADLKKQIRRDDLFEMKQEAFIEDPKSILAESCRFLNLGAPDDYLNDCASIVFKSPNLSRQKVTWSPELISTVAERIKAFPFLQGYTFE